MDGKKIILLAGGTGFIGKEIEQHALKAGHEVRILTRNKVQCDQVRYFYWNPDTKEFDTTAATNVTHLINLCGSGIADKRWTTKRKKELLESRTKPIDFLWENKAHFTSLKHYIGASGINCYPLGQSDAVFEEKDAYGSDYLSQLVEKWEHAHHQFGSFVPVTILRISFVLSSKGGGLSKLEKPVKMGFGSIIGNGKQWMPWIGLQDLARMFLFTTENESVGVFNAVADTCTNAEITRAIAKKWNKHLWLPPVPGFLLKLILGELASLVLTGIKASNRQIKAKGFQFQIESLDQAIRD